MLKPFTDSKISVDVSTKIPARTGNAKGYITPEDLAAVVAPLVPPGEPGQDGEDGQDGQDAPPTMFTVTVETLNAASPATATITGDPPNLTIHFGIPRGPTGLKGDPGTNGTNGTNGIDGKDGDPGPMGPPGPSMVALTMAEYDALEPKDPAIYYDIIDAPWQP